MFQIKFVAKMKTYIIYSITLFPDKNVVYEIKWKKYSRAGETTDDNMANAQ